MEPKAILEHHKREPFCAFLIHTRDGSIYEVARREMMLVGRTRMVIGLDPDRDGFPRQSLYIAPDDVTHIEPLGDRSGGSKPEPSDDVPICAVRASVVVRRGLEVELYSGLPGNAVLCIGVEPFHVQHQD